MSTHANIIIKEVDLRDVKKIGFEKRVCVLYHHFDGYIENGAGDELKNKINNLTYSKSNLMDFVNSLIKNDDYALCENIHGDIEYLYTITWAYFSDKTTISLNVQQVEYDNDYKNQTFLTASKLAFKEFVLPNK